MPENYDDYIRTVADLTARGYGASLDSDGDRIYLRNGKGAVVSSVEAGGGTMDYNDLSNKPSIESVTLSGNKTMLDLGVFVQDDDYAMTNYEIDTLWNAST